MLGLLIKIVWLVITVAVLLAIWRDKGVQNSIKLLWTLAILFLPVLGPALWLLFGKRTTPVA